MTTPAADLAAALDGKPLTQLAEFMDWCYHRVDPLDAGHASLDPLPSIISPAHALVYAQRAATVLAGEADDATADPTVFWAVLDAEQKCQLDYALKLREED